MNKKCLIIDIYKTIGLCRDNFSKHFFGGPVTSSSPESCSDVKQLNSWHVKFLDRLVL
jgi:hypothetical protein